MKTFSKEFYELAGNLPDPGTNALAWPLGLVGPEIKVEWSRHEEKFVAAFEEHPTLRATGNTEAEAIEKMTQLIAEEDVKVYGSQVLR